MVLMKRLDRHESNYNNRNMDIHMIITAAAAAAAALVMIMDVAITHIHINTMMVNIFIHHDPAPSTLIDKNTHTNKTSLPNTAVTPCNNPLKKKCKQLHFIHRKPTIIKK